jgi:outer membrane protein assembly factor BamE (lipoprotein component of BamABCDE complex)
MTTMRLFCVVAVFAALAGCASYDGRGLVPGRPTAADAEALMGVAAMRVANPDGSSTLYFPRGPGGRHTYAVSVGPDGVMRGIEQRLTLENVAKLVRGETSAKQVRELFGPPNRIARAARFPYDVWEYRTMDYQEKRVLWVEFSDDGILRGVIEMHDFESDPQGHADKP